MKGSSIALIITSLLMMTFYPVLLFFSNFFTVSFMSISITSPFREAGLYIFIYLILFLIVISVLTGFLGLFLGGNPRHINRLIAAGFLILSGNLIYFIYIVLIGSPGFALFFLLLNSCIPVSYLAALYGLKKRRSLWNI